jgi:archaellum biogenesis protein FlaJ (TadC family)
MSDSIIRFLCITTAIAILLAGSAAAQSDGPGIIHSYPSPGEKITETRPNVTVRFDSPNGMNPDTYRIFVDGIEFTELEETEMTEQGIIYRTPEVFTMSYGNHSIRVIARDNSGMLLDETWNFTVTSSVMVVKERIDVHLLIRITVATSATIITALTCWYYYLKRTRNYSMEKFFAQNPRFKRNAAIFFPSVSAIVFFVLGFIYISGAEDPSPFSYDYLLIGTIILALAYYSVQAQMERRRIAKYEKAFAQFLFEMADAMRGGIDPTKAVLEMAKTESGILKKDIRVAADSLKMGRPFEEVMRLMSEGTNSKLVMRYASLIGEASKIGGEIGMVLYRAAKDMDDMIKIQMERRRQLSMQSMTMYIALGVLMTIIMLLIGIYPSLGNIDLGFLGTSVLETHTEASEMDLMAFAEVKRRFFHLMLVNSAGAGLIVGKFIDGKVKYGIIYSLIIVAIVTMMFSIFIV